jgi:hypothetical protein
MSTTALSQTKTKKSKSKQQTHSKVVQSKKANKASVNSPNTVTLNSVANYPAKANVSNATLSTNRLTIADPILTTLNARANGANVPISKSGIVGMPKRAYGFANGHISLMSTGATTAGTQTGSGVVGTGSSLGTFGSNGPAMEVNGKSPYAGINMWGNAMNMKIIKSDSAVRLTPLKKQ